MSSPRKTVSYWRRRKPSGAHDIAVLRPPSKPRGKRFETRKDAFEESIRSEALLRDGAAPRHLWEYLAECRAGYYVCEQTFCPSCAREFRRWFIGEVLRIASTNSAPAYIVTVLLAGEADINELDPETFRHMLRKRLDRAGLGDAVVVGGFEMVWRARDKVWVLHANLLVLGAERPAVVRFEDSFSLSDLTRPTQTVELKDLPEQLSYLLKFTTYHRPHRQVGKKRSKAKPLNAKQHVALVNWMWRHDFSEMLFLYRMRRQGDRLC